MDIQMPGMDGLEALCRIRAEPALAAVPLIALTALAMPGDRERCLEAGADDYLSKPVHLQTLAEVMETNLRRHAQSSGKASSQVGCCRPGSAKPQAAGLSLQ
jgi:CheY-like chemotaxis protein